MRPGATRPNAPEATEPRATLALALAEGVGPGTHKSLLARFGSAERALDAAVAPNRREEALRAADATLIAAARCGAALWTVDGPEYPPRLLELPDPPPFLFALGSAETLVGPVVAIVGTRRATAYGERVTRELAGALARAGACVVSGMARGIDAAAHRAALDCDGRTVAVLGTGVDVAYPAAHRALHAAIARCGLVLSEHLPGAASTRGSFPRRNRVIAALADAVVVVEAGATSGALITAGHALDLGRTVAAVPGPIDSPQSAGANGLLRDGAVVIAGVADALALAGLTPPAVGPGPEVGDDGQRVWRALADGALDMDTLATRSGLPARRCLAAVTELELAGAVECELTGEIRRR